MTDLDRIYADNNAENARHQGGDFLTEHNLSFRRMGKGAVMEGEDGFAETWHPLCRSSEVERGQVIGRGFLDGQVAIFRGESGTVSVVSAYCPHIGAHLAAGNVVGDEIECGFHKWRFGDDGACTATGCGDPVPGRASLFKYPTQERWGLVWAFNGSEPTWDLPDLGAPDDELIFHPDIPHVDINADPWIFMTNTFDFNHFWSVHGIEFEDPSASITWQTHAATFHLDGRIKESGATISYELGIFGNNLFWQNGRAGDAWFSFFFPACMHRPGTMRCYFLIAARRGDGSPQALEKAKETVRFGMGLERFLVEQDLKVLNTIRFTRGMLTKSDRALGLFLDHLRRMPRSHAGGAFTR